MHLHQPRVFPTLLGLVVLCLFQLASAADYSPEVKTTALDSTWAKLFSFKHSTNVLAINGKSISVSSDDGSTWAKVPEFEGLTPILVEIDPNFPARAIVFSNGATHCVTNDGGKTWKRFEIKHKGSPLSDWSYLSVSFNSAKEDLVIINFNICASFATACKTESYLTEDGFKSDPTLIHDSSSKCLFPRSNPSFDPSVKAETIVCSRNELNSFGFVVKSYLVKSEDFFKTLEIVESVNSNNGVITDIKIETSFLIVIVQKDKFTESEVFLIVSKDATEFDHSNIDFEIKFGAIFFLKSTPSSLRLAVFYQGREVQDEIIYFSDSTGLNFEKVADAGVLSTTYPANLDGVWFADVKLSKDKQTFPTRFSFDDCKTWELLRVEGDDECVASKGCGFNFIPANRGGIMAPFLSTPNILVGVGSKGSYFTPNEKISTYVSRDGGASWTFALDGPMKIAYADQGNILVAMTDPLVNNERKKQVFFSLDQGKSWSSFELEESIIPIELHSIGDLSSTKVIIIGRGKEKSYSFSLDFSNAFDGKKCVKDDMEVVSARVSPEIDGPTCIRGHKDSFIRRKQDAKCLVLADNTEVEVKQDKCECSAFDFECSPYFKLSQKGVCVPKMSSIAALCRKEKKKKVKLSHQQLILGHDCIFNKKKESDFVAETEFDCKKLMEGGDEPSDVPIVVQSSTLRGLVNQYSYVKSSNFSSNILIHTNENVIFASNDGGVSFVEVPVDERLLFFFLGEVPQTAIMVSVDHLYYSKNGGNTFEKLKSPGIPISFALPVVFDPLDANKFIFLVADENGEAGIPFYTENGGESFHKMPVSAINCGYIDKAVGGSSNLIYCVTKNKDKREIIASTDYFKTSETLFDDAITFAIKPGFVLVATIVDSKNLQLKITTDGSTFANADFPSDFDVEAHSTYTVLDSHKYSVLVHLTTDHLEGQERGAILKSNSNGTSYVLTLDDVNRDSHGYVDYDRIDSLEGVMIANTVTNPGTGNSKKLKTQISFNDGSQWSYLAPPSVDSEGNKYSCAGSSLVKCSLNLHGFTERPDYRDTFSSSSAIGFLIGVGNVGETLTSYKDASTFMSADGGATWKEITKGVYMWEYGDRGTILLLVKAEGATDEILYSTDDGNNWKTFKFTDKPVHVKDLATVPEDTSRKFIIFAAGSDLGSTLVYSLDFTNFYTRQCQIDLDHPLDDDFEYWTPHHPESQDGCLFGHEARYLRRAAGHYNCFIGAAPLDLGMQIVKNCSCTRRDYECDYNYYRDTDGTCKLVKGLTPQDHKEQMCSKPGTFQYFEPTGYRKIPISTCVGGKSFDAWNPRPCPGHEKEFNKQYGRDIGFGKLLVILILPALVFIGVTAFVYEKGIKRNGGFKKFGQIRLNDDNDLDLIEENATDVVVNSIIRGGISVLAGVVATFKTIRKVDRKVLENIARVAFGRRPGRRDYVRVPDDEDELFGNFDDNYEDDLENAADVNFEVDNEPEEFDDYTSNNAGEADARLFDIDDEESRGNPEENEDDH